VAMRRRLTVLTPVASPAMESRARPVRPRSPRAGIGIAAPNR
jgi:hypothetical protein